jgi:hypothetical protein
MKKIFLLLLMITIVVQIKSQHLGAYIDYRDHFYIFDHGKSIQVEDLKPQSFAIGGTCVLYVNNQGHLKLYEDGVVSKLEIGGDYKYYATDHLAAYSLYSHLKVIENGQAVTLSARCPVYRVEDSLIVFYDENLQSLRVYYNGTIDDIEDGLIGIPVTNLASGDNIVAYISSRSKNFNIYYQGVNHTILEHIKSTTFKAGKNIVAYLNSIDNTFHVFYKGEDVQLEMFPPKSYKMGDDFVAYIDNMGIFKVYYHGETFEISGFEPEKYYAEDYLLLYSEEEYFKVFYKGKITEVEGFIPDNFRLDWNSVAYTDNTKRIWLFSNNEKKFLLNEMINSFDIYRDLIIMNVKVDRNVIYYQGEFYEGLSY